jgi:hypothetical protein
MIHPSTAEVGARVEESRGEEEGAGRVVRRSSQGDRSEREEKRTSLSVASGRLDAIHDDPLIHDRLVILELTSSCQVHRNDVSSRSFPPLALRLTVARGESSSLASNWLWRERNKR